MIRKKLLARKAISGRPVSHISAGPLSRLFEALEPRILFTTLTFDSLPGSDGSLVPTGNGSYQGDTPNVAVNFRADGSTVRHWQSGYGDLTNIIYADQGGGGILRVTLTAKEGHQVVLNSFNLATFVALPPIKSVQVLDENAEVLFSKAAAELAGRFNASHTTSADLGLTLPLTSRSLTIRLDVSNFDSSSFDNIGLDDISFTEATGGQPRKSLGGKPLYVITHGRDADGDHEPWMKDMAAAISRRIGLNATPTEIEHSVISYDPADPRQTKGLPNFLLFDWSSVSGIDHPGIADEPLVGGTLAALVRDRLPESGTIDLHFIGFSRGAYVVINAIQRLEDSGDGSRIHFLQRTTLDPQAEGAEQPSDEAQEGIVDWADNYFQTAGGPFPDEGKPLDGALNFNLTEVLREWAGRNAANEDTVENHSEVHDWYHWTIDTDDDQHNTAYDTAAPFSLSDEELKFQIDRTFGDPITRRRLYDPARIKLDGGSSDIDKDGTVDNLALGSDIGFHWSIGAALGPAGNPLTTASGVDLVLVIDRTTSMEEEIASVQVQAAQIVRALFDKVPNARVGVVTYADHVDPVSVTKTVLSMSSDETAIVGAIQSIALEGGGFDLPEDVYSGIMHALDMKAGLGAWRGGTIRKSLILFGDAPPHEPEALTGYSKYSVAARSVNVDPADIFTVVVGTEANAQQSFAAIAGASRGNAFTAAAGGAPDALIQAIAQVSEGVNAPPPAPPLTLDATLSGVLPSIAVATVKVKVNQSIKVTNLRDETIAGQFLFSVYLSADANSVGIPLLTPFSKKLKLKPHGVANIKVKIGTFPDPPVDHDPYYVLAKISEPRGGSSNLAASVGTVRVDKAFKELHPAALLEPSSSVRGGAKVGLVLDIQNSGNIPVTERVTVTISGSPVTGDVGAPWSVNVAAKLKLNPSKTGRYKLSFRAPFAPSLGSFVLSATVDSTNAVTERDELNNGVIGSLPFRVN